MNKTSPAFEPSVTEREMDTLIKAPDTSTGCCSSTKPAEQPKESETTAGKPSCCCH